MLGICFPPLDGVVPSRAAYSSVVCVFSYLFVHLSVMKDCASPEMTKDSLFLFTTLGHWAPHKARADAYL